MQGKIIMLLLKRKSWLIEFGVSYWNPAIVRFMLVHQTWTLELLNLWNCPQIVNLGHVTEQDIKKYDLAI